MKRVAIFVPISYWNFGSQVSGQDGVITTVAGNGTSAFSDDQQGGRSPIMRQMINRLTLTTIVGILSLNPLAYGQSVVGTIAGNGHAGFSGDGGQAVVAALSPSAITLDGKGNIYIADASASRVRMVGPNGVITTIAGTGIASFSGDGGLASAATLNSPAGVAVDAAGNIFIADTNNQRVRKISSAGIISTVAGNGTFGFSGDGGPAVAASFGRPQAVAVDATGNLYVVDINNNRIRKISTAGVVSTIAGNGPSCSTAPSCGTFSGDGGPAISASLNLPTGVAVDSAGNVYVVDTSNNRIRKISANGTISTVAGSGPSCSGFTVICGTYAGDGRSATSAALNHPLGIALDLAGNLFLGDTYNFRVRKVTPAGIISTVVGNGSGTDSGDGGPPLSAGFPGIGAVAVDTAGDLFVASNRVREVFTQTPPVTLLPTSLSFTLPISTTSTQQVNLNSVAGGFPWTATTSAGWISAVPNSGSTPATISITVDSSSLQPGSYTGTVTIATPAMSPTQQIVSVSLMVSSPNGTISGNPVALTVSAAWNSGRQSQLLQINGTPGLKWQASVSGGAPWLSVSSATGTVPASMNAVLDTTGLARGTYQGTITINAPGASPSSMNIGVTLTISCGSQPWRPGVATVAGNGTNGFSGDGGPATSAALQFLSGADAAGLATVCGNLFIADFSNGRIRQVSPDGTIRTIAGGGRGTPIDGVQATSVAIGVEGVAVDAAGNVIVADGGYNVWKVSASGVITRLAGTGIGGFSGDGGPATAAKVQGATGVAIDSSGNVFIADSGNQRIRKVSADGTIATVAGNGSAGYSGDGGQATAASLGLEESAVAVDGSGNLYIADTDNAVIRKVTPDGSITTLHGTHLEVPYAVAADATGNVFVADRDEGQVFKISGSDGTVSSLAKGPNPIGIAADVSGNVFFTSQGIGSNVLQVSTAPSPYLLVAPATLSFLIPQGSLAQSQTVQVAGGSAVSWQATPTTSTGGPWLSISSAGGQTPALFTVGADPSGLMPGTYQGSIIVQSPTLIPPSTVINVAMTVAASGGYSPLTQLGGKLVGVGALNGQYGAQQGYSVALSSDGSTAIVGGAWDNNAVDQGASGAAWVFSRSSNGWLQQGNKLVGAGAKGNAYQGQSVALSADGNTTIVGGPYDNGGAGAAWVYVRSGGVWNQQGGKLVGDGAAPGGIHGDSVALSSDGNTALIGGYPTWVFTRSAGAWSQQGSLPFSACSVALSADGNTAVLGSLGLPKALVYVRSAGAWVLQGSLVGANTGSWTITGAYQCSAVAVAADGNTVIIGGAGDNSSYNGQTCGVNGIGAAWVFSRSGSAWSQQGSKLVGTGANAPCGAGQGYSVALSDNGNTALVGGPFDNPAGATWVYARTGAVWAQQGAKLVGTGSAGNAEQGYSVALSSDATTVLVGGIADQGNAGAAWVFASALAGAPECSYSVSPLFGPTIGATGGILQITVQTGPACVWSVGPLPSWITASGGATQTGAGTLTLAVAANTDVARSASFSIAGNTVVVNQSDAPVISGLAPSAVTAGATAFTLTVNGAEFVNGSTVEWNGTAVATSYVSASQLTASVPPTLIASPGSITITISNPGGTTSNAALFAVGAAPASSGQTISHIAEGGGWRSIIILANTGTVPAPYTVSFWNDAGQPYLPQLATGVPTGTIPAGGSTLIETADSGSSLGGGWAQVTSSQSVGGTAIFRYDPWSQEAAVPMLTGGTTKLEIPYQVDMGLALGIALANPSASQTANITEVIRDQNGAQIASRSLTLGPLNHTAFNPTIPSGVVGGGIVEYDSNVTIYALGIRSAPEGTGLAFTSLDAVAPQAASTKTISHIAAGSGWRSSIVLVNTDTVPAQYKVSFWNDEGQAYTPPLAVGNPSGTIPVGGSTIIETADAVSTQSGGWAQMTSSQSVGGTAIFRYDPWSQEAAVPLLASGGTKLEIPVQVGGGLSLGVALANPSATQTANITEVIRDPNGHEFSRRALTLGPLSHIAFNPYLGCETLAFVSPSCPLSSFYFPGGIVEYDSDVNIYALGIRSAPQGSGLAFTSVRALYK